MQTVTSDRSVELVPPPDEWEAIIARAAEQLPPAGEWETIRENAGVSQAQIAREIGVTRAAVWNWEKGVNRPGGRHLILYVAILKRLRRQAPAA